MLRGFWRHQKTIPTSPSSPSHPAGTVMGKDIDYHQHGRHACTQFSSCKTKRVSPTSSPCLHVHARATFVASSMTSQQGHLAHGKMHCSQDHHRAPGTGLQQGPREGRFLMSEVPLCHIYETVPPAGTRCRSPSGQGQSGPVSRTGPVLGDLYPLPGRYRSRSSSVRSPGKVGHRPI